MPETSLASSAPERIIGYDARDYRDDFAALWPPQRRDQYLYRLDVKKVLSVDARVWPSVMESLAGLTPEHAPAVQALWADLQAVRDALSTASAKEVLVPSRLVAITLVNDGAESLHPTADQAAMLVSPALLSDTWQFVGYDVADAWTLSVLSNCGFLPGYDHAQELRREWAPHLNEFHLFNELPVASAFRRMSDVRLASDHAPTFVYGIRIVK